MEAGSMVPAKAIMRTDVITVPPGEDIREAIRTMALNHVTGLPVVNNDGTLAGIVTEKDVLSLFYNRQDQPGRVEDFMTADVTCFDERDSLTNVVGCLMLHTFRRVPILNNGRLAGIVSRRDIIAHLSGLPHGHMSLEKDSILELLY
jgi:CBS domain-containing protein